MRIMFLALWVTSVWAIGVKIIGRLFGFHSTAGICSYSQWALEVAPDEGRRAFQSIFNPAKGSPPCTVQ